MAVVTRPRPTGAAEPSAAQATPEVGIDLYWLPLGAGGWFVRLNGRIYEAIHALWEHRRPLDLYHTALQVRLPEGRFVIENSWPIPDADPASRGVAVEGPVASRRLARFRAFRYEVRRWRDGIIADADQAVASPQTLSDDPVRARRLLGLVGCLPSPVWGRDELGTGEMWNSNSVIAWLLAQSGLPMDAIGPPAGGRAPGWQAGLAVARRQQPRDERAGHGAGGRHRASVTDRVADRASAPGRVVGLAGASVLVRKGGIGVNRRYAYFYLMRDEPDRVRAAVPRHVAHWRGLGLAGYRGGPFADRTGGLITFEADDGGRANVAVETDPFVREGLLDAYWLKQWAPE